MCKYKNFIEEIIEKDLEKYGQGNPCPMSLTIIEGKFWRHYELGAIYGFVVYNDSSGGWMISSIREDDEYWFAPEDAMFMSTAWIEPVNKTWQRMVHWVKEHLQEGWLSDGDISDPKQYKRIILKPIVPEIIPWPENEEPDNAVLGTKFCRIENEK